MVLLPPKSGTLYKGMFGQPNSENPGYISMVSVVELYWVLTSAYELSVQQVEQAPDALLRTV